jgi:hypothetical protein
MSKPTEAGYGRPPTSTRLQKDRSGTPKDDREAGTIGRPMTWCSASWSRSRKNGEERRVTAAEAFLLHMTKRGLDGDGAAARSAMAAIEEARAARGAKGIGDLQTYRRCG